jgi:hypothetical protein
MEARNLRPEGAAMPSDVWERGLCYTNVAEIVLLRRKPPAQAPGLTYGEWSKAQRQLCALARLEEGPWDPA